MACQSLYKGGIKMKSEKMMKGLVCHKDGTIELLNVPVPGLVEDTDAIVRVSLSTI